MLRSRIASVVSYCARFPWCVIAIALELTFVTTLDSARHFAINTDLNRMISPDLPWRQREIAISTAFVERKKTIVAVVEAPTSELASEASIVVADRLKTQPNLFTSVDNLAESTFFNHHAILSLPTEAVHGLEAQLRIYRS